MKLTYVMCGLLTIGSLVACSKPAETKKVDEPTKATMEVATQDTQSAKEYVPNPDWETLKVGAEVSYEPFEFKDKKGLPTGFEIELIQEIAKVEKFNVQIFNHSRKDIVPSFDKQNISIWASALSNSPKRAELMDLSNPIITTEMNVFVLDNDKNKNVTTAEDLKGKIFGVSKGASSRTFDEIEKLSGSKENVAIADSFFLAMTKVYSGKADAIYADKRVAQYFMQSFPEHKLKAIPLGKGEVAISFAVKKGDKKTLNKVNHGLKVVKENGTYDKLIKKWFGKLS